MAVAFVYITLDSCQGDYIKLSVMVYTLMEKICSGKSDLESNFKELKN